jgi:hypothetical protein
MNIMKSNLNFYMIVLEAEFATLKFEIDEEESRLKSTPAAGLDVGWGLNERGEVCHIFARASMKC